MLRQVAKRCLGELQRVVHVDVAVQVAQALKACMLAMPGFKAIHEPNVLMVDRARGCWAAEPHALACHALSNAFSMLDGVLAECGRQLMLATPSEML